MYTIFGRCKYNTASQIQNSVDMVNNKCICPTSSLIFCTKQKQGDLWEGTSSRLYSNVHSGCNLFILTCFYFISMLSLAVLVICNHKGWWGGHMGLANQMNLSSYFVQNGENLFCLLVPHNHLHMLTSNCSLQSFVSLYSISFCTWCLCIYAWRWITFTDLKFISLHARECWRLNS